MLGPQVTAQDRVSDRAWRWLRAGTLASAYTVWTRAAMRGKTMGRARLRNPF